MDIAHDLLSRVKALASDLGRSPTRDEFAASLNATPWAARTSVEEHFGSFTTLLQAAGLETYSSRRGKRKITNEVFSVSIDKTIEKFVPRPRVSVPQYPSAAIISDIHWPFSNARVVTRFLEYVGDVKPDWVIINGDAWDMYSHSRFPRSHMDFTPREEHRLAREMNEKFWITVRANNPQAKKFQLIGNHELRPLKRILESYPAAEDWVQKAIQEALTFGDVTTIFDPRQELMIAPNIAVHHGYKSGLGAHSDHMNLCSINGHTHVGGVVFKPMHTLSHTGQIRWELNCGLAGEPEAKALTYTAQKMTNWTPGFGALDPLGPRFIAC